MRKEQKKRKNVYTKKPEKAKKEKDSSIRAQIFSGYRYLMTIIILIVIFIILDISVIFTISRKMNSDNAEQLAIQESITGHYMWLENLNRSVQLREDFTGSIDPAECTLGKWISSIKGKSLRKEIQEEVNALIEPHDNLHVLAGQIEALSKTNRTAAYQAYTDYVAPNTQTVIEHLLKINDFYINSSKVTASLFSKVIIASIPITILMALIAISLAAKYGNKTSKKISEPISAVAEWSKKLSLGSENLSFDKNIDISENSEVGIMIKSFKQMAQSIQDNVRVIQKVADGDMTPFVNIRSSEDSLGKNLYKMVQTNDIMFSKIISIATSVAIQAGKIADTSLELADEAIKENQAMQELTDSVENTQNLLNQTANKTKEADKISNNISMEIEESINRMKELLDAMQDIRDASDKVSAVIKAITEIADQTNLLALNAAIEAAKAGEAGKGFAVVASEIRNLANQSSLAADESKLLIQNTINKSKSGTELSQIAYSSFDKISKNIKDVEKVISYISSASDEQKADIEKIRGKIEYIVQTVEKSSEASHEAAKASKEMNDNAEFLKNSMSRFNLRQRQPGQAYIPPEKLDDENFIKIANENYKKALESGKINF